MLHDRLILPGDYVETNEPRPGSPRYTSHAKAMRQLWLRRRPHHRRITLVLLEALPLWAWLLQKHSRCVRCCQAKITHVPFVFWCRIGTFCPKLLLRSLASAVAHHRRAYLLQRQSLHAILWVFGSWT